MAGFKARMKALIRKTTINQRPRCLQWVLIQENMATISRNAITKAEHKARIETTSHQTIFPMPHSKQKGFVIKEC